MKDLKISKPVNNLKITSRYGYRWLNNKLQFHDGIDVISQTGDNSVFSIFDGVVVYDFDFYIHKLRFEDKKHSGGNYIIIKSILENEIYFIRYLHLLKNYLSISEVVSSGDLIGEYADVGYSFGSHLHIDAFDSRWKKINIEKFLKKYGVI